MIRDLNGDFWLEILFEAYANISPDVCDNQAFYDFAFSYCGFSI